MRILIFAVGMLLCQQVAARTRLDEAIMAKNAIGEPGNRFEILLPDSSSLAPGSYTLSYRRGTLIDFDVNAAGNIDGEVKSYNGLTREAYMTATVSDGIVVRYESYEKGDGVVSEEIYRSGDTVVTKRYTSDGRISFVDRSLLNPGPAYSTERVRYTQYFYVHDDDSVREPDEVRHRDEQKGTLEVIEKGVLRSRYHFNDLEEGEYERIEVFDAQGKPAYTTCNFRNGDRVKTLPDGSREERRGSIVRHYDRNGKLTSEEESCEIMISM